MMKSFRYFIEPQHSIYSEEGREYLYGCKTYSEYNYLRPGMASWIKKRHFEVALALTRSYFHACNVIDFGCADGILLPSLAQHFNHVTAIDRRPDFIEVSSKLVNALALHNVNLICNETVAVREIRRRLSDRSYRILYLLETLEHIGEKADLYGSKIVFLKELFTLLDERGLVVISVPKMVGLSFFIQRFGLAVLGCKREPISTLDLVKASFLNDTTDLEKRWDGDHLGFNHRELEIRLKAEFEVVSRKDIFFQVIYLIKRREPCERSWAT